MRTGIVIFARFDSRRLPGKVMHDIGGRSMLGRVIDRVRQVSHSCRIVVATTSRACDDAIATFASANGVSTYRGDCDDVAKRAFDCAVHFGFTRIVRISGDSPFIDPDIIDRLLALHDECNPDIVTNVWPRTYPFGMSGEVITKSALERILARTDRPEDREHVTRYAYGHPEHFSIRNHAAPHSDYAGLRLVVDTADDLQHANAIAARLGSDRTVATLDDIVRIARTVAAPVPSANAVGPPAEIGHDGP